jgi:hypothetical protein
MNYLITAFQHFYHSIVRKDKHDWEIIMYCVGTAALFWFLNAMGKIYHHKVLVPVVYQYDEKKMVAISSLPSTLEIEVEGRGWDLLRQIWSWDNRELKIRIENPLETKYLIPGKWQAPIKEILSSVKVEEIATDTIFCRFDRLETKLVGLYADLKDIKLRPGYQISSHINLNPKFIEFKGASSLIKNLPPLLPLKIDARNVNDAFDQNVPLDFSEEYPRNNLLTYEQEFVNVRFSVRPSLEEELEIPLETVGAEKHPGLFLKERKVLVTFLVSETDKKKIKPEAFKIIADFQSFNPADSTIEILVKEKPAQVSDVQVNIEKTRVYGR